MEWHEYLSPNALNELLDNDDYSSKLLPKNLNWKVKIMTMELF